jgi:hypothetical protein
VREKWIVAVNKGYYPTVVECDTEEEARQEYENELNECGQDNVDATIYIAKIIEKGKAGDGYL